MDHFFEFSEGEQIALAALADTQGKPIEQVEADLLREQLQKVSAHQQRLRVVRFPQSEK